MCERKYNSIFRDVTKIISHTSHFTGTNKKKGNFNIEKLNQLYYFYDMTIQNKVNNKK